MGYVSRDIAVITEPKRLALAAVQNFVQFASKARTQSKYQTRIKINATAVSWTAHSYYDVAGVKQLSTNPALKTSSPLNVVAARGLAYSLSAYGHLETGYVIGKNDAGAIVFTKDITAASPPVTGTMPADITTLYITNDFAQLATPALTIAGGANLLGAAWETTTVLNIIEPSGLIHSFNGSADPAKVGGSVYYVAPVTSDTAENLRQAFLSDLWVAANFDIALAFVNTAGVTVNDDTIVVTSKGYGAEFNIGITTPNDSLHAAYGITIMNALSQNGDSISGEASTMEIDLDLYLDHGVFLGAAEPAGTLALGNYAVTLSKTYAGVPVWFELSAFFAQYFKYALPPVTGWIKTGTLRSYRFVARVAGVNNFAFYQSSPLYVLNGYGYASEGLNLEDYVYVNAGVKLLTNKPRTPYIKGQREYINFIFSDLDRGKTYATNWTMKIMYRAYAANGKFLGSGTSDTVARYDLNIANTCALRIDDTLTAYPNASIVKVALARGNAIISNDLEYQIRPESLHGLNQFTFLNRLGGWDSFNFDASPAQAIKPTSATYLKNVTPSYVKGDSINTTYSTDLAVDVTVEGAPVTDEVAEWLKELAASRVILDNDRNRIIITDFALPTSAGTPNMQIPTIKYQRSDTYTND